MPPDSATGAGEGDSGARELSTRVHSLWQALGAAYDEIQASIEAPEDARIRALSERILELETRLRPLAARLAETRAKLGARAGAELTALWNDTDALVVALAGRHAGMVAAAARSRDRIAAELARFRTARGHAATYERAARGRGLRRD